MMVARALLALCAVAVALPVWQKREYPIALLRIVDAARGQAAVSEGLRIQLVDQEGRSMYAQGSAKPNERARILLRAVARFVIGDAARPALPAAQPSPGSSWPAGRPRSRASNRCRPRPG